MTESDNFKPLTYGAIVSISFAAKQDQIIYSDGFIKNRVYLKDFGINQQRGSFYRSLFKLYPSFTNTYKKEAQQKTKDFENNNYNDQKKREEIEDLKEKLLTEYKFNQDSFDKVDGVPIVYEQPLQFLHIASNKFLACSPQEAEIDRENYKIELVDAPSDKTIFKISPSYKHQKESEGIIYYGDLIHIVSANSILNKFPYLHSNVGKEIKLGISNNDTVDSKILNMDNNNSKEMNNNKNPLIQKIKLQRQTTLVNSSKKEVNASLDDHSKWRIKLYASSDIDPSFLQYGDVIWLNHAEFNSTLIAKKVLNSDLLEVNV